VSSDSRPLPLRGTSHTQKRGVKTGDCTLGRHHLMEVPISEKTTIFVVASVILFVVVMLFAPAYAQDAEIQTLKREVRAGGDQNDIEGRPLNGVQCVYQSQSIALKWINENLAGEWTIKRLYCGPPKRNI
jgi:hypothetical protein